MKESFLVESFKYHYQAYINKSTLDYRQYKYRGEIMEEMASDTLFGVGCNWFKFKKKVIDEGSPANYTPNAAFIVGLWVCAFIWWYVNRFKENYGQDRDRLQIKKIVDNLWKNDKITKNQYFIYDNELMLTFDRIVDEFCDNDIVTFIKEGETPKRVTDNNSPNQKGVGGISSGYKITARQKLNANKLGVTIKPSVKIGKKIDVYKNGQYVCSIGDIRYLDYEMHLKESGKAYADERRKAYKSRHEKDRKVLRSVGYYADKILW